MARYTSIKGRQLGVGDVGQLVTRGINATNPVVDCSITVSAEGATTANTRDIVISLKDAYGNAVTTPTEVELVMFLDAGMVAYVTTGGSTGLTVGAAAAAASFSTVEAKKRFKAISEADGDIHVDWLDTGTEVAFLGVKLPSGRMVISDALTNA